MMCPARLRRWLLAAAALLLVATPPALRADPPATAPATRPVAEGERLDIGVVGLEHQGVEARRTVTVLNGQIKMPQLKPLRVAGLMPAEVKARLDAAYHKETFASDPKYALTVTRRPPLAAPGGTLTHDDAIVVGERLTVVICSTVELNKWAAYTLRIGSSGTVSLPSIGEVPVVGVPPNEAAQRIGDAYWEAFVVQPFNSQVMVLMPDRGESVQLPGLSGPVPVDAPAAAPATRPAGGGAVVPMELNLAPVDATGKYGLFSTKEEKPYLVVYLSKGDQAGFDINAGKLWATYGGSSLEIAPDDGESYYWKLIRPLGAK